MKNILIENYPVVEDVFRFIGMDDNNFWDYLSHSDITWGGNQLTLIDSGTLFDMIQEFIEEDSEDVDNETYLERLKLYKQQHDYDYHVIE